MSEHPLPDDVLRKASKHVWYEYWMLDSVTRALTSGAIEQPWLRNALLESFVIHYRALYDFFYLPRSKGDDMIAADFFDSPDTWAALRPAATQLMQARKRAGKEIVHLTYARLDVPADAKHWSFGQLATDLRLVVREFAHHAPSERLEAEWREAKNVVPSDPRVLISVTSSF
jgi:hypothetical protein